MVKIVCQHCGITGYLQHIGRNYYRVRHYVGYKNGKPVFKYHRQDPTYVHGLLNRKEKIDPSSQINIDPAGQNVDPGTGGNTFKSENKRSLSGGSGSIVRSSIAASRHNGGRKPRTRVRIPAGAPDMVFQAHFWLIPVKKA